MSARAKLAKDMVEPDNAPSGFADLVRALDAGEGGTPDPETDPGAAFRFVYDGWVRAGGSERGKRRHSVRQIKEWLGRNQVLSLETKLSGKTWLQVSDASNLLRLFLSRWRYNELSGEYTPLRDLAMSSMILSSSCSPISFRKTRKLCCCRRVVEKLRERKLQGQEASRAPSSVLQLTTPTREAIPDLFEQSDVLITVSRARTVVGGNPPVAMKAFHDLVERLYKIDGQDHRKRSLIWIIDFGLRTDKYSARAAIYNVYFLIAQFRAIALIEREGREEFYQWLLDNVCIIVGSLRYQEIDKVYRAAKISLPEVPPDLMWFQSDRLFLESIPGRWIESKGSHAFGRSQRELWEVPTITLHLNLDDWPIDQLMTADSEVDTRRNLRYLFHAEVVPPPEDPEEASVRSITLPEPGSRWSDAYRMAVQAAFGRLGRRFDERAGPVSDLTRPWQPFAASTLRSCASGSFLTLPIHWLIRLTI